MKKLLTLLILFAPLYAQAVNYLGFGGGNYVYAEQNNLYFNLNTNAFDNRKWTYDGEKFTSNISIKMDLKTKYTNEWYEEVLANKKSDGLMYANYIKQPFNYQNRGGYQKVILPAAAWALGGFVARSAAFNAFRKYAIGTAVFAAAGSAYHYFCSELMNDAITCGKSGVFEQIIKYKYELKATKPAYFTSASLPLQGEVYDQSKALTAVNAWARPVVNDGFGNGNFQGCTASSQNSFSCRWTVPNSTASYAAVVSVSQYETTKELIKKLNDDELIPYFDKTCRLFSSECVNEPTNGKNIQDVQLTAGSISGGVNVTGPPYTNPITGEAQQDKVVIGGTSSGIGINSGTNSAWEYTPSMGQSTVDNKVDVSTTARPDLTNTGTAEVAKPNNQTGTKPEVIKPSVPDINIEFPEFTDIAEFCQQNPKASACIEFEEVEKQNDKELPEIQETFNFNKINIFASNGLCPQGSQFTIGFLGTSKTFELSFQPACDFAEKLRYVLIAIAMLIALKIVFGFGGVKK